LPEAMTSATQHKPGQGLMQPIDQAAPPGGGYCPAMYPLAQRAAVRMSIRGRFPADGVSVVNGCPVSRQRIPRGGPLGLLAVLPRRGA